MIFNLIISVASFVKRFGNAFESNDGSNQSTDLALFVNLPGGSILKLEISY